jgi:arylsulfatase A-like enzyme
VVRRRERLRRLALSLFGGSVATALCAALEALWVRGAAGASPPAPLDATTTCLALLAPLGTVLSFSVWAAFAWLSPAEAPSLGGWIGKLRRWGVGRQADVAAFAPLAVLGAFLWTTACAHLARIVLGLAIAPRLAGLAAMAGALALGVLFAIVTLALLPPLRRMLATIAESHPASLDPMATGGVALLVVLALFVFGMVTGTVSGDGGFFAVYGIFKRPELDLRVPGELALIALASLLSSSVARPPRSPSILTLFVLTALAVAPAALLPRASTLMSGSSELSLAVERGAPLTRLVVGPMRRLGDRDGDGFSASFGGGDCDDASAAIHPGAEETLDNGVDEDCSGADLTKRIVEALAPAPEAVKVDERLFPKDLNVVLITVDTLRFDLGYAGYQRPISPNIDALAARSVVFDRAYALASYTGKSIGPMLIGKYGEETNRNWGHFNKFSEADTFLAQRLQRAGVRTMGVHGHRYFDTFGGLERGFDVLDFSAAPPKDAPWDVDTKATSAQITDAALALLGKEENTRGRFFLWVHYLDPHADYLRHEGIDFGNGARDLYDGEVAFTDRHVGRLLTAIDEAPWGKRTAILLTSDHGEAFGEHGMYRHGFEVWEPLVRVPLLVHVPGVKPRRIAARRSLIDLAPTVLELTHVEAPPPGGHGQSATDFLSGQSLLVDLFLPEGKTPAERDVFVDMPAGPYNDARRALIHGEMKLIVAGESRFSLYDLAKDPGEEQDLAERDKQALAAMKERYAAFKARLREVKVTGKRK